MTDAYATFARAAGKIRHEREIAQGAGKASPARRQAVLTDNAEALTLLRQGLRQPWVPHPLKDFDTPVPELAGFRNLARLLRYAGETRDAAGDIDGAATVLLDGAQFGVTIGRDSPLIHLLVGIACEAIVLASLGAMAERLPAKVARAAAKRLETIEAIRPPFADTLRAERAWMANGIAALDAPATDRSEETDRIRQLMRTSRMSAREVVTRVGAHYDQAIVAAGRPYAPGNPFPESKDPIVAVLVPHLDNGRRAWLRAAATSRLLLLRLALRAHRATRGVDPTGLGTLVSLGFLSRIPADPFGNAPLRMRRLPGGTGLLVYSVGPDGRDDGGQPIGLVGPDGRRRALRAEDRGDLAGGVDTP